MRHKKSWRQKEGEDKKKKKGGAAGARRKSTTEEWRTDQEQKAKNDHTTCSSGSHTSHWLLLPIDSYKACLHTVAEEKSV